MGCFVFVDMLTAEVKRPQVSPCKNATASGEDIFRASLMKKEGTPLGAAIKRDADEIILCSFCENGVLKKAWDAQNPETELQPGWKILSVNGVSHEYFKVAAELWKVGQIDLELQKTDKSVTLARTGSRVYLADEPGARDINMKGPVDQFRHLCARDCGAEECAICFEDLESDARVVQLPCKHTFHPNCTARWFAQGKRRCPLCVQQVDEGQN